MVNLNESIIVCQKEYLPLLFRYKNANPNYSFKIITRNDFLDLITFQYIKDPVPVFIESGLTYNKAKKLAQILRVANIDKSQKLKKYYELIKGDIQFDEYGEYELSHKTIYLFELDEDCELKSLIKRHKLAYFDLTCDNLGLKTSASFNDISNRIFYFENKFEQFSYIFSDIRAKLLKDPSLQHKIQILCKDDSDIFYIKLCANLFGIECFYNVDTPLLSNPNVGDLLLRLHKNKSLSFEPAEDNEYESLVNALIDQYGLRKFSFDFAYPNLLEILANNKEKVTSNNKGIIVSSSFNIEESIEVYVTNFQDECFYKVYDDNNVINDAELDEVEANPSYYKTLLDKRLKLNYMKFMNVAFYSRVTQHLSENIYDSQFISELNLYKNVQNNHINSSGFYKDEARKIINKSEADKQFYHKFLEEDEKPYDYHYKHISNPKDYVKPTYSVTNLESYVNCPFAYLMNRVIPSKDFDPRYMARGQLIHKVFENINHPDFDFEKSFALGVKEYKKTYDKTGYKFTTKNEIFIDIIHHWLSIIARVIHNSYKETSLIHNPRDLEQEIQFNIHANDGTSYLFNGKIDKILWTEHNGERFYTIVDYKSGAERFDPKTVFIGKSIQLPLYYYGILQNPLTAKKYTGDGKFGGFAIQPVFPNSLSALSSNNYITSETLESFTKLQGLTYLDDSYLHSIDPSTLEKEGQYKSGNLLQIKYGYRVYDDPEESIIDIKKKEIKYSLKNLIDDACNAAVNIISHINAGDYDIAPTPADLNEGPKSYQTTSCTYCPYGDICYKNIYSDTKYYKDEIDKRFKKGKK